MRKHSILVLFPLLLAAVACWHQVVSTGAAPGATVIDKPFVGTYVFGLVPAAAIDVRKECPSGTATVETEMSFVNWLATVFTVGIYSPRHVTVTCAAPGAGSTTDDRSLTLRPGASDQELSRLIDNAAALSAQHGAAVTIHF